MDAAAAPLLPGPPVEDGAGASEVATGAATPELTTLPASRHGVSPEAGVEVGHQTLVPWASPRLRHAMMQSGVERGELFECGEDVYLRQAQAKGAKLGWKSKKAMRQIAARRYRSAELQRRKLLDMVVDMREGMIRNKAELSVLLSPSKPITIADDPDMSRKLEEEAERRRRAMVSEEQRAADANRRIDEQMQLKLQKEKEMLEVNKKFARARREREQEAQKRREAAILWQVEMEKQRAREEEQALVKARSIEAARVAKEEVLDQLLRNRQAEVEKKARVFAQKQQAKQESIKAQWEEGLERQQQLKLERERKLVASERARAEKLAREVEERRAKGRRKSEEQARRLRRKREADAEEHRAMCAGAALKLEKVERQLATKRAAKARLIEEGQQVRRAKEHELREFALRRAEHEAERVSQLQSERARKNETLGRVLERNEEVAVLRSEAAAVKFEETVRVIRRKQRSEEWRAQELAALQAQKAQRAVLLQAQRDKMTEVRRYAAQQFLIEQERMHEDLESRALSKSMEMASLSMGTAPKRLSLSEIDGTLRRLSTPLPRPLGRLVPPKVTLAFGKGGVPIKGFKVPEGMRAAVGRESPLPVWTWSVQSAGSVAQPKFVS